MGGVRPITREVSESVALHAAKALLHLCCRSAALEPVPDGILSGRHQRKRGRRVWLEQCWMYGDQVDEPGPPAIHLP
jgi:hypothetical protein